MDTFKKPQLWLLLVYNVLAGCMTQGLIPAGRWSTIAMVATMVLTNMLALFFNSVVGKSDAGAGKISMLLPFLVFGALAPSSCAHSPGPAPSTRQYEAAFGACMEAAGIQDASGIGKQVLQILETPGLTQTEITQRVEALGIPAAGQAVEHVAICAVEAWIGFNPIGPSAKPTPAQAAVRVFKARHARPTGAGPR